MNQLRIECFDLLLELFLFLTFSEELFGALLKGLHDVVLILLHLPLFLLQLHQLCLVNYGLVLLLKLSSEAPDFVLVFTD